MRSMTKYDANWMIIPSFLWCFVEDELTSIGVGGIWMV
jgi:hypothetical protein